MTESQAIASGEIPEDYRELLAKEKTARAARLRARVTLPPRAQEPYVRHAHKGPESF